MPLKPELPLDPGLVRVIAAVHAGAMAEGVEPFSYVSIEERIPASHPLRRIRKLADQALDRPNPTFSELYASEGRPSVPPEQLLLEQLHYNLLFRWFVGLNPDDPIWHPTTFTKKP